MSKNRKLTNKEFIYNDLMSDDFTIKEKIKVLNFLDKYLNISDDSDWLEEDYTDYDVIDRFYQLALD